MDSLMMTFGYECHEGAKTQSNFLGDLSWRPCDFATIKILDFELARLVAAIEIAYNKVKTQAANSPPTTGPITGIHE